MCLRWASLIHLSGSLDQSCMFGRERCLLARYMGVRIYNMCNTQGILHYCCVVYQLTFIKSEIQSISIFQINIVHTCN